MLYTRVIQRILAYQEGFFIDLASFLAVSGLSLLLWKAVRVGGAELPMPWGLLLSYLCLAFVVMFSLEIGMNNSITAGLRNGSIAIDLLRPAPLTWLAFCNSSAWGTVQALYACIALGLLSFFLPQSPLPADLAHWAAFALSLGLALFLQFGLVFLFAQGSFITQSGYGTFYMRLMLHQVFSGAFAPVAFFPGRMHAVAMALPFRHVVDTPVRIALGLAPWTEVPGMLLAQLAWGLGIFLLGQLVFRFMLGRVQIQGG